MTSDFTRMCVLFLIITLAPAHAQEVGTTAPALDGLKYVKGDKADLGDENSIVVVEFWATWCPPCRASIPQLTELQKTFKDKKVVIVGISDEDEDTVKPFVSRMGASMDYTVAIDPEAKVKQSYMGTIDAPMPYSFIVQKGKVLWHGFPMLGLDRALELVSKGETPQQGNVDEDGLPVDLEDLVTAYMEKVSTGTGLGAREIGEKILERARDAAALNQFAWMLLTDERIKRRDLELAVKAAESAHLRANGRNPAVADTYARAQFEYGLAQAIKLQRQAVKLNRHGNAEMQAELKKVLQRYEKLAAEQAKQ